MISKKRLLWVNALVIIPLLLTACGPAATPPPPTVDVNALYTQAAVTMVAQLTANAPTFTPTVAASNTPVPSLTPLGGALPTLPPVATLPPLFTPTNAASSGPDKAMYITQSPADYESVTTGKVFNIIWRLRNTGTTTWTTNYVYRFYAAINKIPTAANGYNLPVNVPPNGEVDLKVVATAPGTPGTYDTQWVITNPDGVNFSLFTLTLNVVQGTSSGTTETKAAPAETCPADIYLRVAVPQNVVSGTPKKYTDEDPSDDKRIQGGRMRIKYKLIANSTTSFTVSIDGANYGPYYLSSGGIIVIGNPDQEKHNVIITVSGTDILTITELLSANINADCL